MKSKLVQSAEESRLEPTAIMGNESGIYFTFMDNVYVIGEAVAAGRRIGDTVHAAYQLAYRL